MLRLPQEIMKKYFISQILKVLSLLALAGLTGCSTLPQLSRSQGALQVTTGNDTSLAVYLDEIHLGETPFFDERIKTGDYTLALKETNSGNTLWQSKIKISKRTLTVANFVPTTNPEESSSEILYLEPLADKEASRLSISTLPDHVVVKVNGQVKGFTPITFDDIAVGDQEIVLEAPGFLNKTINAKTTKGHHLIIQAELGRNANLQIEEAVKIVESTQSSQPAESTQSAEVEAESDRANLTIDDSVSPTATPTTKSSTSQQFGSTESGVSRGYETPEDISGEAVEILTATVGIDWLRVRETANGLANNEVARVKVGDFYPFIQNSDNQEWSQIEYAPNKKGWVSAAYAEPVVSKQAN